MMKRIDVYELLYIRSCTVSHKPSVKIILISVIRLLYMYRYCMTQMLPPSFVLPLGLLFSNSHPLTLSLGPSLHCLFQYYRPDCIVMFVKKNIV